MRFPVALRCLIRCWIPCSAFFALAIGTSPLESQDKVITEGDALKYFKGTENPPVDWTQLSFDDSAWLNGQTPIGYSTSAPPDLVYKTPLADMQMTAANPGYLAFYVRKKFDLANANAVKSLKISFKYDDGFIAYLNGVEVLRKNMNAGLVDKDTAGLDHETNTTFEANIISCDALSNANLQSGPNVLAVEAHNVSLTSSDCSMSFELETVVSVCPTSLTCMLRPTGQVLVRWTKPASFPYDELALYRNEVKIEPGPLKTATSYTDRTPVQGVNNYRLVATACGTECTGGDQPTCSVTVGGATEVFRRGDSDDSGTVNLTDAVKLLGSLFRGEAAPPCPDAADFNDDGNLNLTDAVYLLTALFRGGPQPPDPGAETCGADATADELGPCTYTKC